MAQVQHTPGPWELDIEEYGFRIRMGSAVPYTGIYEPQHVIEWDPGVYPSEDQDEADAEHRQYLEAKANMERIVAAVNAVEGIPTEALEAGVVRKLIEAATKTALALLDEINRLQQKVQRANALAVAVEQVLKAWSMGDYLTPFMDDLRNALLDFERTVASENGWLKVAADGERGGGGRDA